jgi:3-oxoacyl-[acyl-carrier protein] reductase
VNLLHDNPSFWDFGQMEDLVIHKSFFWERDAMRTDMKGKRVLVCGASQGIGRAAAGEMAALGAEITLLARNSETLDKVRKQLPGINHQAITLDLSDLGELKAKVQLALQNGAFHVLICNSGGPKSGPILDAEVGEFETAFKQHVLANHLLVKLLVPGMKASGYGRIINILSTSVKQPLPNLGVSNTIRGAVASWAKTLAMELGPHGITVNNILPGYTTTERLQTLAEATAKRIGADVGSIEMDWKQSVPLKRFAEPKEIGEAIAFLASPAASYVNGINLPVDGGRLSTL